MSRPYRLYPLRYSRDPLTAQEMLDAPERTVQVRPPLTEAEREMRRLREALRACATNFDLILVAVAAVRCDETDGEHARLIETAARAGKEASRDA